MNDTEIFVITDNLPFKGTYYKGHSSSKKLNQIILGMRLFEIRSSALLHIIHVAGTRMKDAGIDGLSHGDVLEGMMVWGSNSNPLSFVPFHLGGR